MLFSFGSAVAGQTPRDQAQNDAFRGLPGVMVLVSPFDPRLGLTQDQLARDVDQWIRQAGIRTFNREEFPTVKGYPALGIDIYTDEPPGNEGKGTLILQIRLGLYETVVLERDAQRSLVASTWDVHVQGGADQPVAATFIRTGLRDLVDKFIESYRAANGLANQSPTSSRGGTLNEAMVSSPSAPNGLATLADLRACNPLRTSARRTLRATLEDLDEQARLLTVREAVYDGIFDTPKTEAGLRQIPLSNAALEIVAEWRARTTSTAPDALLFSTRSGKPWAPNNVLRRHVFPACKALGLRNATWLTFRRTCSSWSHDKGVPGKVIAQLMGHANMDTTLNVYAQVMDGSLRAAVEIVGTELFTIVHKPEGTAPVTH
jgi:hypothetical protein